MASEARRRALETLAVVHRGRRTLGDALAAVDARRLEPRERDLVHELVLGTLRRRGHLDHVLAHHADRPLGRVTPGVLDALRLGAYQLLFLRVKPHAAVSESVDLARAVEPRAAGFANAVLRRLQREGPPPLPDAEREPLAWLETEGSLPRWLAERWTRRVGAAGAVARARALLEAAPTHFRLNPRRAGAAEALAAAGVVSRPTAVPGALELLEGRLAPFIEEGVAYAQDEGSQAVAHLAATAGRVLDACAAPGGKTLLLADLGARVVANEASPRRLATLVRLVGLWGAPGVSVLAGDAGRAPFREAFDTVLLDAPCTGLGTLARNPDIRWRVEPAHVARHAERQGALLAALAPLVRPGGRLVYATCSVEPEENEDVVDPFLAARGDFAPDELPTWATPFRQGAFVRMEPARRRGDAFFVARLRRAG